MLRVVGIRLETLFPASLRLGEVNMSIVTEWKVKPLPLKTLSVTPTWSGGGTLNREQTSDYKEESKQSNPNQPG
jgi:hypothetical protein